MTTASAPQRTPDTIAATSRLWHPFADMAAVAGHEFVLDRAEDVWVYDRNGTRYLDATAGLWYCNVGHGRREITDAVSAQLARLDCYQVFGDFANAPALELAETLADLAPMPSRVFLTSGGGDSIDTAAKLARRYWAACGQPDRTLLISREHSYHGTHGFGTTLAGIPANTEGFGPRYDVAHVSYNDPSHLERVIAEAGADRVAAFFVEPVIGAGGVYPPPPGYLEQVDAICKRHGILLICDSVICGFGRLGTWFGIERFGITPDMIVFAKGVTSGTQPLGGLICAEKVCEPFYARPGGPIFRHGPTYSGHPVACAAALANIGIMRKEDLLARSRDNEIVLFDALSELADHPAVEQVRGGVGLLAAIALHPSVPAIPEAVDRLVRTVRHAGVLIRPLAGAVAVSPPLTATTEHIQQIRDAVARGLDDLRSEYTQTAASTR